MIHIHVFGGSWGMMWIPTTNTICSQHKYAVPDKDCVWPEGGAEA